MVTMVEDNERFTKVATMLFGDGLEKTIKEHVKAMRCIRKSLAPKQSSHFFRKSRSLGQHYIPMGVQVS